MRAALLRRYGQPLEMVDLPTPAPGEGQALVQVAACGVCGSDHFLQQGGFDSTLPIVPGHEAAGTVAAVGPGVKNVEVGQRVAIYYIVHCGRCRMCSRGQPNLCRSLQRMGVDFDGGFAEYVEVPAVNLIEVPDGVSLEEAAVLTDAVATPYHALRRIADVMAGETVLVLGVGGIGSNAVQLASHFGCRVIAVSRSPVKLELASRLGAADVIRADEDVLARVEDMTRGEGPDVILQTVGSAAVDRQAIEVASAGTRVVLVGASTEPFEARSVEFIWRELRVSGSRGFTPADIVEVLEMRMSGALEVEHLVSSRRPLDEVQQAIDDLSDPQVLRTVITPGTA